MTDPFDLDQIPTVEPAIYIEGSTIFWRIGWTYSTSTLQYTIRNRKEMKTAVALPGVAVDGGFRFTIEPTTFDGLNKGDLIWLRQAVRTSDSAVSPLQSGDLKFFAAEDDRRTHAEIMVVKLESLLEGRADHDVDSYSIGSRSITKMSIEELRQWRDFYRAEVERGENSNDITGVKKRPGLLKVGFSR